MPRSSPQQASPRFRSPLVRPPLHSHTATVIFCHGLGETPAVYEFDIQLLAERFPFVKWILPSAQEKPVPYNNNAIRPSWFDVWSFPPSSDEYDESGVAEAMAMLEKLILREVHDGLPPNRIILAGFCQGASLCLMTGLTTWHEIGGVASMAGWIPHRAREHIIANEPSLPLFWAYGSCDTEITSSAAKENISFLRDGLKMEDDQLHVCVYYGIGHEASESMFNDLSSWIINILCR